MIITVRLYAGLARRVEAGGSALRAGAPLAVELPQGATVAQLLARLGLPEDQVQLTFINGRACPRERPLQGGDQVGVFPPIGGG